MVATQHASPMAAGVLKNLDCGLNPANNPAKTNAIASADSRVKATPPARPMKPSTETMQQLEKAKANSAANSPAPQRPPQPKQPMQAMQAETEDAVRSQANSPAPKRPPLPKEIHKIKEQLIASGAVSDTGPSVPAHRFMVSMQGHGYPWSPVSVPEVALEETQTTIVSPKASTSESSENAAPTSVVETETKLVASVEVPAYRFISTMAGHYGFPHTNTTAAAQMKKKEQHAHKDNQMTKLFTSMSVKTKEFVNSVMTHKPAKTAKGKHAKTSEMEVPAYRFLTSMQGYGYPLTHEVKSVAKKTTVSHADTQKQVAVPAYRFMTSMQGYGYPYTPAMSPKEAAKAKKSFMESMKGGASHLLNSIKASTKSLQANPSSTEKIDSVAKSMGESTVPAYRFMTSMQGYGYPVTAVPVRSRSIKAKKEQPAKRKSIIQEIMGKIADVTSGPYKAAKLPDQVEVPAYRFLTTMQGYGYPVVSVSPSAVKPPVRPSALPAKGSTDNVHVDKHTKVEGNKEVTGTQPLANKPKRPKSPEKQNGFMRFFKKLTTKQTKPASAKSSKESLNESAEHKNKGKAKGKESEAVAESPAAQQGTADVGDSKEEGAGTPKTE